MSMLAQSRFAQRPSSQDVDRANLLQDKPQPPLGTSGSPEGFQNGQAAASPNDADIGQQEILKRDTQYQPLSGRFSTPIFYTSNVALTRSGEISDIVIAPMVAAYYQ